MGSLRDQLNDFLAPMKRKISLMVNRAVIALVNDQTAVQLNQLKLLKDEVRGEIERFQQYGFTSVPLPGAEAVVTFLGGDRGHGIVIATEDRRYRLKGLAGGEVALYTDEGDKIHFKRNNIIEIETKTLKINAETKVEVTTAQAVLTCDTAEVTASESASVDAPEVLVTCESAVIDAAASVDMTAPAINATTPLLTVSGLISCAGIGAGLPPVAGKALVAGEFEALSVKDAGGTLGALRAAYNSHVHGGSPGPTPTV